MARRYCGMARPVLGGGATGYSDTGSAMADFRTMDDKVDAA